MFHQMTFFDDFFSLSSRKNTQRDTQKDGASQKKNSDTIYFHQSEVEVQRRPYQRSLNLLVRPNGALKVTAGRTVPAKVIQNFLLKNSDWIEKSLSQFASLRRKYPPKEYVEGEGFIFNGKRINLKFVDEKKNFTSLEKNELLVSKKHQEDRVKVRTLVRSFYEKSAIEILTEKVEECSTQMGLYPKTLRFKALKSQWGSCSSHSVVTLNWRLIVFPEWVWTYVIVHELAHLEHPNHSAAFWKLVGLYFPEYKTCRQFLSNHHYEVDFLAKKSELYVEE